MKIVNLNQRLFASYGLRLSRFLQSDSRTAFAAFQHAFDHKIKDPSRATGFFGFPDLAEGEKAYAKLTDKALSDGEKLLQQAFKSRGKAAVVEKLDELSNTLCKVADMAEFIRYIHPPHSEFALNSVAKISSLVETLNTDVKLYELLAESMSDRSVEMDPETLRTGTLLMHDFEQSGIHLEQSKREKCVTLNDNLLELGQNFMNGTSMPVAVRVEEVPEQYSWMFTPCQDSPGYVEMTQSFQDHDDAEVRRIGYSAFFYQEATQENILTNLIMKRHSLAELCGFQSYSHKVSRHSVIGSSQNVDTFLESLNQKLLPFSAQEFRDLQLKKGEVEKNSDELDAWDIQYYMNKTRPHLDSRYRNYFSLATCIQGLNMLCNRVFQISLNLEPTLPGEVWHPSVRKLSVYDIQSNQLLGFIYCDFFMRDSKPASDCHFTIRGGKLLSDGSYQIPIVALLCNFKSPESSHSPVLLNISQVENLFHEMGHALHSMLARTRFQHVSGTRCVTDFAEVPSNLLEFFTRDDRVLRTIAKHHQSEEPIPEDLLRDLQSYRKFGAAADMQHQLLLTCFDHELHAKYFHHDIHVTFKRLCSQMYPAISVDKASAFYLRFGHLVGYGAKYYSYLFCKAIATKIWQDLFLADPFSQTSGTAYKQELLVHGGAKEPKVIMENLLGVSPSISSLTDSLISAL